MKILVVDDSAVIRKILRKELEEFQAQIEEASSGEEALEKLPRFQPDLLTLDVEMEGLTGFQVCSQIRSWAQDADQAKANLARVPVVFVTSNDTMAGREEGFRAGGSDFITKPFIKGEVVATIQKILHRSDELSAIRALVVDDNRTARELLRMSLGKVGVQVTLAADGTEALELIRRDTSAFDIVITDFIMLQMNGDELCRNIREQLGLHNLPVIFLTSLSERDSIIQIFQSGATDYLIKPFISEELLARLRIHCEQKLLKDSLQAKVLALKAANKIKDEFLGIMAHDLRSPLTGILGYADLLQESEQLQEEEREFVAGIQDSGEFLLTLVNDILDLSKLHSSEQDLPTQRLDLLPLAKECLATLQHMAGPKAIRLQLLPQSGEGEYPLQANKPALMRVINNLLSNAVKFTPRQGQVSLSLAQANGQILVQVKDTGIGIPPQLLPHLFDRFTKTSQKGTEGEKSTGLGMSITKELVERHAGSIQVQSQPGQGTLVTLSFPLLGS